MTIKTFLLFLLFINSLNSFAAQKVLVTVNGSQVTKEALMNFKDHVKKATSLKETLSEMITLELLVAKRLETPIKDGSRLQLELERNRKAIIAANMIETMLGRFKMTEQQIKEAYEKDYLSADKRQEYNANHILVKSNKEADEIIKQLNQGADFETLAKQHSTGPSGETGGALGWFTTDRMVKPFSDATSNLTKGSFSQQAVKTQFGWHIIKLNDLRKKVAPSFSSVKENIMRSHSALKLSKEIQKLHDSANIIVSPQ